MRMIKLIILILALSGSECRYQILKDTSVGDKKLGGLVESAVLSLLSCYEKKVDTVGAVGITEPTLINLLLKKQLLPVKIFGEDGTAPSPRIDRTSPHKLHLFVVETSSSQQLMRNILRAVTSQLSAHLATFLIIDWPSQNGQKGCSEADVDLWPFWTFSILNAFYVCVDKPKDRVFVYTYNPYTSKAPAPWMLNTTINGYYDHPWSLFVREYHPGNQEICNNLDFVKNHDLGGYRIRCAYYTYLPLARLTTELGERVLSSTSVNIVIAKYALKALNATLELHLISGEGNTFVVGNFSNNFTLKDPYYKYADVFLQFASSTDTLDLTKSMPLMKADFVVMTHHRGEKSQLDKLIGVFDRTTRYCICLVIIGTLLFFKFSMRQPLGEATLNVIRIIGNTGLLRVPNRNAPRLYLAGVFILVVTIIGVYQGLLASLLTKPTPLPEINTLEDLANSPHKIYLPHPDLAKFFTDPRFNGRLATLDGMCERDRHGYMIIRPLGACLQPRINLIGYAIDQNLHISREEMLPAYASYRIRDNWALEERFNEILASYVEGRVLWHVYERDLQRRMEKAEYMENLERNRPTTMKLSNLGFAFAFLGIGLSLATVVFVIEVAMSRL